MCNKKCITTHHHQEISNSSQEPSRSKNAPTNTKDVQICSISQRCNAKNINFSQEDRNNVVMAMSRISVGEENGDTSKNDY